MNSLRCIGLLLVVLLSACDADKAPPPAKVTPQASPVTAPVTAAPDAPKSPAPLASPVTESVAKAADPVHELSPNMAVVPVVAASKPDVIKPETTQKATPAKNAAIEKKASVTNAKSAKVKADNAAVANRAAVASKSKPASQVVKETRLPKASLDLSLPPEMVKQLTPPKSVITASNKPKTQPVGAKPLLPKMFSDTESDPDFQLQGRLLSNEMQLQLRNESRREVEGAALDFKFKQ